MNISEIKQVFIKSHDNDFWNYYLHALKQIFDYQDYFTHRRNGYDTEKLTKFIKKTLDNLYHLEHDDKEKFPWDVKVFYNDDAKQACDDIIESHGGNSECAYMDIETYLLTPGAKIEQYIHTV